MNLQAQQLIDVVTEEYLKTQKSMSVKEIAQRLRLSPRKTRNLLNEIYGDGSALSCSKDERATYSKDYPMMQHGYIRVYTYEPSKHYLALLLNESRLAAQLLARADELAEAIKKAENGLQP